MKGVVLLVIVLGVVVARSTAYEVVYAINAGGRNFLDSSGIEYEEDTAREGHTSNHGARFTINRVPPEDAAIYQTERYSTKSFSYTIPLHGEGKYLLVLKFCEVFFEAPNKKVFDVVLNDAHVVITDLDLFREVGHATAHDEYIPFTVSRGKLFIKDGVSDVRSGRLKVSFLKGQLDNPKINAIVLVKGADAANEFPRLPPLSLANKLPVPTTKEIPSQLDLNQQDEVNDDDELVFNAEPVVDGAAEDRKARRPSGPKQPDPYAMDSSLITILLIVVATIIPIVILRCRI